MKLGPLARHIAGWEKSTAAYGPWKLVCYIAAREFAEKG